MEQSVFDERTLRTIIIIKLVMPMEDLFSGLNLPVLVMDGGLVCISAPDR